MRPRQSAAWVFLILIVAGCAAYQAAGQGQIRRAAFLVNPTADALAYFQQVAQTNPNYIFQSGLYREGIWTYIGRSQYLLGRLPEARQSLEKALSVDQDDYLARIYLGLTLLRSGEDSRGFKELGNGIERLYYQVDEKK